MAQNERPGRHSRQPSRITTPFNVAKDDKRERQAISTPDSGDTETVAYIKRILCSKPIVSGALTGRREDDIDEKPLEELLPPLTSSNEIDVQLYAIIAVILSQFVQAWYNRITPDGEFINEVVQVIAHCMRGLEGRLRHADLETLLLDELPGILHTHLHGTDAISASSKAKKANLVQLSRSLDK